MFDQSLHDSIKRKNKIFVLCVSICVVLFTAARMLLTRFYIDPHAHFYTDAGEMFGTYFDYLVAACIAALYFTSFFLYSKKTEGKKYAEVSDCFVQGTQTQVFTASLTGFLFIACSVFQVYSFINPGETDLIPRGLPFMERLIEYISIYTFDFVIFFFSVLSALYFFKTAALNFDIGENIDKQDEPGENDETDGNGNAGKKIKHKYSSGYIIFSFMPIIWAFLNTFKSFFDMSKSVNSPVRIYELVAFLAISAYFVAESRMLVDRRESSKFYTFAYIAAIIAAVSALPNLIWSSFWIFAPNSGLIIYALQLAVVFYILSRLYAQIRYSRFMFNDTPGK